MKTIQNWFKGLPQSTRQWLWFVMLWCGGFLAVFTMGQVIRLAMGIE